MTETKEKLMDIFEEIMPHLGQDLDFTFKKEIGYMESLTAIAYMAFVEGTRLAQVLLTMEEVEL